MEKLPWFPRPLIVFAMVAGVKTPCVQWHGKGSDGNAPEGQMLFPLDGHDARYVECVRPDFWRVSFLGSINAWNKLYPKRPFARASDGEVVACDDDDCLVKIIANELRSHKTISLTCRVAPPAESGVLYVPQTYENPDANDELPRIDIDRDLQEAWRKAYLAENHDSSVETRVDNIVKAFSRFDDHSSRYRCWLEGEHVRRFGLSPQAA